MGRLGRWWWILPAALVAVLLKGLLLTAWVAGQVEDAAAAALDSAELDRVEFVEVSGVDGLGGGGLNVVLLGPAEQEKAAVAAVEATDEINKVSYRILRARPAGEPEPGEPES